MTLNGVMAVSPVVLRCFTAATADKSCQVSLMVLGGTVPFHISGPAPSGVTRRAGADCPG